MPPPRSRLVQNQIQVMLPLPLEHPYSYSVPDDLAPDGLSPGDFVRVPLGRREAVGVVWDQEEDGDADAISESRLRPITARLDVPAMTPALRQFVAWLSAYTVSPTGSVLRMAMSVPAALEPPRVQMGYCIGGPAPERMTPSRDKVLSALKDGVPRTTSDIAALAGVSGGVVRGLINSGTLLPVALPDQMSQAMPDWQHPGPTLSAGQQQAADELCAAISASKFAPILLEGVTGSGKTEVYFEAIAATLAQGRQVLVLVPEIALTAQWLDRFAARFGAAPTSWHSDLTASQRRIAWRAVSAGQASVVVGARSALFLPFPDLGFIVVDEEHDPSFKQEDGVIYNARDMAVARASIGHIPVVLASATPSLESVVNARDGRYRLLHLPDRHGGAVLPEIEMIDMREVPPPRGCWISPPLAEAVTETLTAGEQVLLFLNRRGFAPLTLCRTCGHRLECPNCSAWLVDHRRSPRGLMCHHCGFGMPTPDKCPECDDSDSLAACGPGAERLAEEVAERFPEAHVGLMTSDSVTSPQAAAAAIERFASGEVSLLIGTQIIAKGLHFPNLTLVGVVDADIGLGGGDLRAAERTFQLLSQVAGRAGRAEKPGRALIQSYMPHHPVMEALAAGDNIAFVERELAARRLGAWPPYGRLAAVIVSSESHDAARQVALKLGRTAPRVEGFRVLGPAPAPLSRLRGRFRFRLLLKTGIDQRVQPFLEHWVAQIEIPRSVRVQLDVDPYNFL